MNNKVFYSANNTQFENMGDGIIGRELLNLLRSKGALVVDTEKAPDWFDSVLGLQSDEIFDSKVGGSFIKALFVSAFKSLFSKNHIYLAVKPGHTYSSGTVFREISYTCFMVMMKLLRVKVIRFGCSLGPFTGAAKRLESVKARCFSAYTARDDLSISYAQSLGIKKVRYCPDLAFGLDYSSGDQNRPHALALSFRTGTISEMDKTYMQVLEKHLLNSNFIRERKESTLCCSQVERDNAYVEKLKQKIGGGTPLLLYSDGAGSIESLFSEYEKVDMVLSNRLHVLLCAASRGAIPVAVLDQQEHKKIVGVFQKMGLDSLIFDICGETNLDDFLDSITEHKILLREKVKACFARQRKLLIDEVTGVY